MVTARSRAVGDNAMCVTCIRCVFDDTTRVHWSKSILPRNEHPLQFRKSAVRGGGDRLKYQFPETDRTRTFGGHAIRPAAVRAKTFSKNERKNAKKNVKRSLDARHIWTSKKKKMKTFSNEGLGNGEGRRLNRTFSKRFQKRNAKYECSKVYTGFQTSKRYYSLLFFLGIPGNSAGVPKPMFM